MLMLAFSSKYSLTALLAWLWTFSLYFVSLFRETEKIMLINSFIKLKFIPPKFVSNTSKQDVFQLV